MSTNHYALKFAREAYQDARHNGGVDAKELAKLKAEWDRQERIYQASLPVVAWPVGFGS